MNLEWHTEQRKINDLIPFEKNPRKLTDTQSKQLQKSLEKFNLVEIPAVDTDNKIIAGHQRLKILQQLGRGEEVIDVRVPNRKLTEKEFKEYLLRSNKNTGEYDFDILKEFDEDLLLDVGFEDLSFCDAEEIIEDEVPAVDETKEPIAKLGDIWQLGRHRVMCGDCIDKINIEKLMQNNKATLGFNDPPYGMKKEKDGIISDNLNEENLLSFNAQWILLQFDFLKENGSFYCWGTDEGLINIHSFIMKDLVKKQKVTFRNLLTWDKGFGQGQLFESYRMYSVADEKCLFYMCGVQGFNNNADNYFEPWEPIRNYLLKSRLEMGWDIATMKRIVGHSDLSRDHWTSKSQFNMPTKEVYNKMKAEADKLREKTKNNAFKKEYDEVKKEYDEVKKEYYSTRSYFDNTHDNQNNVWHFERTAGKEKVGAEGHATPKPIKLCERAIKSSCPEDEIVLDFFLGSGSTLIACEQLNRICYGMEIDPYYVDVIIKRWENFTNQKTVKL